MIPNQDARRKAQFFIITTILISGALLLMTNLFASTADIPYNDVLTRHDTDTVQNVADRADDVWWNSDWQYRTGVTIEERNGSYLEQEPVPIVLPIKKSRANRDCSDIRVVQNGKTQPWITTTGCDIDTYQSNTDAVARYKMDEGYGPWANDSTGNGHDGVLFGDPQWVGGRYGTGLEFDGTDDYVEIPDDVVFDGGSDATFSVGAWFRPTAFNQRQALVAKEKDSTEGDWGLVTYENCPDWGECYGSPPFVGYYGEATGNDYGLLYGPVQPDEWQHATFVLNQPDNNLFLYYNGELVAANTSIGSVSASTDTPVTIGRVGYDQSENEYFEGRMDDIRIYTDLLQPDQIQGIYQNGIGLNITVNMTPLAVANDLFVYHGNLFAIHPNHNATDVEPSSLAERPQVINIGVSRSKQELISSLDQGVEETDNAIGPSLDYVVERNDCDSITLRSTYSVLERDICHDGN